MTIRGWHEGSVFQRADGRWVAMVSLPGAPGVPGGTKGKGKRKSLYGKTRQEVLRKLAATQRELERGFPVVSDRQTVGQYLADWLITQAALLRPRSYVRYGDDVRLHLTPTLGMIKLRQLTAQHIERLYAEKRATGLSAGSLQHLHAVLHKALSDAVRLELAPRNVASLARRPHAERVEMRYFTPEQALTFLRGVAGDPLEAFYALAINTGMRRGEILALHWRDVHLEDDANNEPYLEVKYTLQDERGGRFTFAPPKTDNGHRQIQLNQTALRALLAHQERQRAQRLTASAYGVWQEQDLVFTTAIGGPLRGNHILERHFAPLCQRLGLPRIRLHDLRHTAATLMLGQRQPTEYVAKVLGHSTPSITSDIYMHVTAAMTRAAVTSLDALFPASSQAPAQEPPKALS